jgi:ATP-binding cassette subfamily B protein
MNALRPLFAYLKPHWLLLLGAFLSLLLVTAANLYSPQVLRILIDQGMTPRNMDMLVWSTLGLVGIAAIRGLFSFTQGFWTEKASQSVAYEMRNELFRKIQGLSFSYHDKSQTGQLMTRLTSDIEQIRTFISMGLLPIISTVLTLIGSIIALVAINWRLALISLATIPLMGIILMQFMRIIRPLFSEAQSKLGALNTVLQENLVGIRVVQAFAREPYEAERYQAINNDLTAVNIKALRGMANNFPLFFLISNLGTLAVIWYGGREVIGGLLSIGELVAFNTYLALLIMPIMMLGMITAQLSRASVSSERVAEILNTQNEVMDRPNAITLNCATGRVVFENVWFGYGVGTPASETTSRGRRPPVNNDDKYVLKGISFVAEPGMTVAIMGRTGAGKSSIINLIPRFYDASAGRVTIDGTDVRDATINSLRDQIGIVLQDTTLLSGSIRDNIAYGRPDASNEQVEAAARAAQAHTFISSFPDGYNTIVGERGIGLSGGQRQRIAIARALLRDPRLLILDDSTSAVDAETEYQLQQALDQLMAGRTSFVIAQRISTVRNADLILLLENGRIVAQGTHEELLANSALYGEIIDSQFGGVRADTELVAA